MARRDRSRRPSWPKRCTSPRRASHEDDESDHDARISKLTECLISSGPREIISVALAGGYDAVVDLAILERNKP